MTEFDSYMIKIIGGGLGLKIIWDWLKNRKNGGDTFNQKICDDRHDRLSADITSIKANQGKLFDQSRETGECVARIEGYLKK